MIRAPTFGPVLRWPTAACLLLLLLLLSASKPVAAETNRAGIRGRRLQEKERKSDANGGIQSRTYNRPLPNRNWNNNNNNNNNNNMNWNYNYQTMAWTMNAMNWNNQNPQNMMNWNSNNSMNWNNPRPTHAPQRPPTRQPFQRPPTRPPQRPPTRQPQRPPTRMPQRPPTRMPQRPPTRQPFQRPPTRQPRHPPTRQPQRSPTRQPQRIPTRQPQHPPTRQPQRPPTRQPQRPPTRQPQRPPTRQPQRPPTRQPQRPPTPQPFQASTGGQVWPKPAGSAPTYQPITAQTNAGTCQSAAEILCQDPDSDGFGTTILCDIVKRLDLEEFLVPASGSGLTIFAPTDQGFLNLPGPSPTPEQLEYIVSFHLVSTRRNPLAFGDLTCQNTLESLNGESSRTKCEDNDRTKFQKGSGNADDNLPRIVRRDIPACNNVMIHVVDNVILPNPKNLPVAVSLPETQVPTDFPIYVDLSTENPTPVPSEAIEVVTPSPTTLAPTVAATTGAPTLPPTTGMPTTAPSPEATEPNFVTLPPSTGAPTSTPTSEATEPVLAATSAPTTSPQTVVEVAIANSDTFSSLVEFVVLADLVEALNTTQDITVFAPTNDAFALLGDAAPELVDNLQSPEWSTHLRDVLLYHVLPLQVPAFAVSDGSNTSALNGEVLVFFQEEEDIVVNSYAKVVLPDVDASNGIIHAIDNILTPSWVSNNVVDRAFDSPILSTLVDLVEIAQLVETLSGPGPFTVFAPTNDAFLLLLGDDDDFEESVEILGDDVPAILTYHVVPGIYAAADIANGLELTTVGGGELTFGLVNGTASVNGATIVATDILANNGIVHVLDEVLIPDTVDLPPGFPVLVEVEASPTEDKELAQEAEEIGHSEMVESVSSATSSDIQMELATETEEVPAPDETSEVPSVSPTEPPSEGGIAETLLPTKAATKTPTVAPSVMASESPTTEPTPSPSKVASAAPTENIPVVTEEPSAAKMVGGRTDSEESAAPTVETSFTWYFYSYTYTMEPWEE